MRPSAPPEKQWVRLGIHRKPSLDLSFGRSLSYDLIHTEEGQAAKEARKAFKEKIFSDFPDQKETLDLDKKLTQLSFEEDSSHPITGEQLQAIYSKVSQEALPLRVQKFIQEENQHWHFPERKQLVEKFIDHYSISWID